MIQSILSLPQTHEEPLLRAHGGLPVRSALVTGASGFIGGHLVEALQSRGVAVRCLVREGSATKDLELPGVEFARADLDDATDLADALDGIDCVFHLAGQTSAVNLRRLYQTNAVGTERLAEACARASVPPVLVYCSSIAAAGPIARHDIRTESHPPTPISEYGRSKLAGEMAVRRWADRVPSTIVRPGIVFGPRSRETLPLFQSIADFGVHFVANFNPPNLSLLHVADLIDLLVRAAVDGERLPSPAMRGSDPGIGCYFATDAEHPSYTKLGRMIGHACWGGSPLIVPLPELSSRMLALASELLAYFQNSRALLSRDKIREASVESWAVSGDKAARHLVFLPGASLADRLRETARWYREAGWTR